MRAAGLMVLAIALPLAACGSEHGGGDPVAGYGEAEPTRTTAAPREEPEPVLSIAEVIAGNPELSTLTETIKEAGLDQALAGDEPVTLLAPTNTAFDKLGAETLAGLKAEESRDRLSAVLRYHVLPGRFSLADLRQRIEAGDGTAIIKTLQGETLTATIELDQLRLTDANGKVAGIAVADVAAANGMVHAIDAVIAPAE